MSDLRPAGSPITKEYKNLEGIGGWLLLVAIGIVVAPIRMMIEIYQGMRVFADGAWETLTSPTSDSYLPGFGAFVVTETTVNFLLLAASFYVAFVFFTKRRDFPRWYVAVLAINSVFVVLDALAYWYFFHVSPGYDLLTVVKDGAQVFVAALIWIPYMLLSDRVKETFVRPSKSDSPM